MFLIEPIAAFTDNYIWLITNPRNHVAAVVDPGDALPVQKLLKQKQLLLKYILITHHHFDHSGGAEQLMHETGAEVLGPKNALFAGARGVSEGERCVLEKLDLSLSVLEIPGHTLDHVAFLYEGRFDKEGNTVSPFLFCGDTLFTGGCGRVFEGTPAQMLHALKRIKSLASTHPETLIYCGHEYTEANLKFAERVEAGNEALLQRIEFVREARKENRPTVPSTLLTEIKTNPFLRTDCATIRKAAENHAGKELTSELEVFITLRHWKNNFKV